MTETRDLISLRPSGVDRQGAVVFLHALATPAAPALAGWLTRYALDDGAVEWLRRRGLAPYVFHRLTESGLIEQVPTEPRAVLRLAYSIAWAQAEQRARQLAQVLVALAEVGIVPVLFKGASLAHTVYPAPACRQMGDLDLWLTADEMPRGQAALEALGYESREKKVRPRTFQERHLGEIPLVNARPGSLLVELHWSAFAGVWLNRTAAVDHQGMRDRARTVTVAGQPALTLAPEDAVIQLAVHLAVNHQMAAPWVRGLLDVALVARTQAVDWDVVAERARAWRVSTAVWLVLQLAIELVGLTEARPALVRLEPSAVRRWLLARLVNADSLLAQRDITRSPWRFVLLLLLVDRLRDAAAIIGRALWPEDAWLAARYGRGGARARLRHLAAAVRGQF